MSRDDESDERSEKGEVAPRCEVERAMGDGDENDVGGEGKLYSDESAVTKSQYMSFVVIKKRTHPSRAGRPAHSRRSVQAGLQSTR